MTQPIDHELVEKTKAGDHDAYKELVSRYQGHVYGLAYSLVSNWADAQDIAQETFIRAYTNIDQLNEPSRFPAWLRRVTFSVAMNWLKAYKPKLFEQLDGKVDFDNLDIPDFSPGPPEVVAKRDLAEAVLKAVESLPRKYRVPLTMFHLDGLSYKKVADFLDIPLGTAKSLIHRAKEKLKPALSAYAISVEGPEVQEVFNEHKLPEEFVRKVLENIADLDWQHSGECTFCGSVAACMKFLKEDVKYEFIMGVSGSAFKLLWYPQWCSSNNTLLVLGTEPIQRTFRALGYQYQFMPKTDEINGKDKFRQMIMDSIQNGRPVIVEGIVGPPECGVVTGYDENGNVVFGRSYFHKSEDYYQKSEWYKECHCMILIVEKQDLSAKSQILRDSLQWAVNLARTSEWSRHDGAKYACGLVAYKSWAEALKKDEDFPEGNLEVLTSRCNVSTSVTLSGLRDARSSAVKFLQSMVDVETKAMSGIQAAIKVYQEEVSILSDALEIAPLCFASEEKRLQIADPKLRRNIAKLIIEAKIKDEKAVEHLEQALKAIKD